MSPVTCKQDGDDSDSNTNDCNSDCYDADDIIINKYNYDTIMKIKDMPGNTK